MDGWTLVARVPNKGRIGPAVIAHDQALFVVGGYNRDVKPYAVLDDVQCFDLLDCRWLMKKRLAKPRCHAALVEVNRKLYLVGGGTVTGNPADKNVISTGDVEIYNDDLDTWSRIALMRIPRHDMTVFALGLYSIYYII